MDPDALIDDLSAAWDDDDHATALDLLADYREWLDGGGFKAEDHSMAIEIARFLGIDFDLLDY